MSNYVVDMSNERTHERTEEFATREEALIAAANWCKAVHPPPHMSGRFWGPPRHASVLFHDDAYTLLAQYWRAYRGRTSNLHPLCKHIGSNVIRVLWDEVEKPEREINDPGPIVHD